MGLFIFSKAPASPMPPTPVSAADRLIGLLQDGRSLERYVEEFVELAFLTNWPDSSLNALFLEELDESTIRFDEPDDYVSLSDTINLILYLNGSESVVEEVSDVTCISCPVPPEARAVPPSSSTCPSSEFFPCVLPDPQTSAGPGRPKTRKRKSKQPKTPEFPASVQPKSPEFSAPVQPEIPVFSAPVQPESPEMSASRSLPRRATNEHAPVTTTKPISTATESTPVVNEPFKLMKWGNKCFPGGFPVLPVPSQVSRAPTPPSPLYHLRREDALHPANHVTLPHQRADHTHLTLINIPISSTIKDSHSVIVRSR
ncbi:hypothetical protein DPX16_20344 [Anabarilius grahami]|uniref:Retrotransposon gag domain-containing protein n=1 Tax=Anabarilius grahami TaxID=495550 RepID=A0A3N0XI63_ANAGA|nr:hypothetical protein DPX16_20344 [Anabarilius grahami]